AGCLVVCLSNRRCSSSTRNRRMAETVKMESQEYISNGGGSTHVPASSSLASSVLQNVFRRDTRSDLPRVGISVTEGENLSEGVTSVSGLSASELARSIISRLDGRKERASVELGIAAEEVQSLPFDLSKLESEGIFMNIDCRGFGSLVRQLEWKTLGVRLPEDAAVRVSPPRA